MKKLIIALLFATCVLTGCANGGQDETQTKSFETEAITEIKTEEKTEEKQTEVEDDTKTEEFEITESAGDASIPDLTQYYQNEQTFGSNTEYVNPQPASELSANYFYKQYATVEELQVNFPYYVLQFSDLPQDYVLDTAFIDEDIAKLAYRNADYSIYIELITNKSTEIKGALIDDSFESPKIITASNGLQLLYQSSPEGYVQTASWKTGDVICTVNATGWDLETLLYYIASTMH